jgi:ABC-2 type transport system ATP-binding protein
MNAAIDLEDVVKVYSGDVRALDAVTLTVPAGAICAFLGRNGAGKTTTVRILSTLTRLTSGRARVCGVDVAARPHEVRRLIGVAMQTSAVDELMTGREHVELVAGLAGYRRRARRQRADELLELLGLSGVARRVVATYSGGMRRRLDLALALVQRPRVLFLDEPSSGLDLQSRRAVWTIVRDLRAAGSTVFLTTHDLGEANQLADTIAVIDAGRVQAMGSPAELKETLERPAVTFQLAERVPDEEVLGAFGDAAVRVDGFGVRVPFSGTGQELRTLLDGASRGGLTVERVSVTEPSLEDVYVGLTGTHVDLDGGGDRAAAGVMAVRQMGVSR